MAYSIGSAALISTRRRCGFRWRCQRVSRVSAQYKARLKFMILGLDPGTPRHIVPGGSLQRAWIRLNGRARICGRAGDNLRKDFFLCTAVILWKINLNPGKTARADDMQRTPPGKL